MKKVLFLLYPNRSGVPKDAEFSILVQIILGVFTLISGLNIFLASLHQITSVLLILSALNLYYLRAK